MQAFPVIGDMQGGVIRKREMGEEKPPWFEAGYGVERGVPKFKGDVRRRSGGENEWMAVNRDSRGIADEGDAIRGIKVCDVMRSVAGSIENLELASP